MGGDKGGDWAQLGSSIAGAAIGTMVAPGVGTAAGWQIGSQVGGAGSNLFGMESGGDGFASKTQGLGNTGSSLMSMGSMAGMGGAGSTAGPMSAMKGSGSSLGLGASGTGMNAASVLGEGSGGGAAGMGDLNSALLKSMNSGGGATIPTKDGYAKFDQIAKGLQGLMGGASQIGSMMNQGGAGSQDFPQPFQPTPILAPTAAPVNLPQQVMSAQLMNPASQGRLAFRGRM